VFQTTDRRTDNIAVTVLRSALRRMMKIIAKPQRCHYTPNGTLKVRASPLYHPNSLKNANKSVSPTHCVSCLQAWRELRSCSWRVFHCVVVLLARLARALQALSDPYCQSTCLSVCPQLWR